MSKLVIDEHYIRHKIFTLRGKQVMLDRDLAELYQVETKVLNQAVKRNKQRFPAEFMFQLTKEESDEIKSEDLLVLNQGNNVLRSQNVTLKKGRGKHRKYLPYAFTESGVAMLSAVLRSDIAIEISIKIMNAFVNMRRFLIDNASVFQRFDYIEQKLLKHEKHFKKIFEIIENKVTKPKHGIFFNGQVFDAYLFISDLIKDAQKSIVLIDNYIDETVLTLFSKNQKIEVTIYTKNLNKQLTLDLKKYNAQYKSIKIEKFSFAHDRFLIIDDKEVYHFGASLKDLGKKWFAFSKFDIEAISILSKLPK